MSVDQTGIFVKPQNRTLDAFLGGRLTLAQSAKGFRAGSDSILLGAAVPRQARRILDLGTGAGAAGLTAALWAELAEVLLVDRDEEALALVRDNIARNGLGARVRAVGADVTAPGSVRAAAGLVPDHFDAVIANPPFFVAGRGTPAGGARRDLARHAGAGEIGLWVRAAASAAAPRGQVVFILPAARLAEALEGFGKSFGGLTVLPIAARPGKQAGRFLIRGIKGSRAGLQLFSPLVLHEVTGNGFAPEIADILMGRTNLVW